MLGIIKKISRNKIFYCFLFLIVLMFPHTIYMQSDNNTKLVVTTIGIDKDEEGYSISSLAVIPKVSTDVNANLETFEGKGKTVSEALQNISLNTGKQIGLAHCDCIILSYDVMQENIALVLDYFIRTANLTTNATILATDKEASKLVEVSKNSNNLLDLSLKDIVSYEEDTTLLENTTIEKFYRSYFSKANTFFLPIISVKEESSGGTTSQNSGESEGSDNSSSGGEQNGGKVKNDEEIAILSRGKFVRTLTKDEAFIYNLISKSSQYLNIEIEDINDKYTTKSLEVFQQVTKVGLPLYKFENGTPYVQYEIWLNVMLEEMQSKDNFAFANIDSLQNFLSDTARNEILKSINNKRKATVETMQKEKNDILNLYAKFNAYKHKKWVEYLSTLDNPEDYLTQVDIRINIHLSYVI